MEEIKLNLAENADVGKVVQTEEIIKPIISVEMVEALAERLYGISCLEVKELNSYDDKNFKITEDPNMKNPLITKHCPHGYVLKVVNSKDSQNLSMVEATTETMIFLGNHQINCPKPIRNVYGHYFSLEKLPSGKNHVVRLLEYQPGEILLKVPKSDFIFYQMGEYVANLDRLLKTFYHSGFVDHKHTWMLDSIPEIGKYKSALNEPDLMATIDEVLEQFDKEVAPNIPKLEKGIIHGDFNEQNIIVNLNDSEIKDDWRITSVIDFGDFCISPYLFELAITMTYAMLVTGELATGGLVLAGYSTIRIIPEKELKLLKICIAGRICQSLIMGAYSFKQNPNNEYLLSNKKEALRLIPLIWNEPSDDLITMWKETANDYLTRSSR